MREYTKKAKGQECTVYEVLVEFALKYNPKFRTLILPKPIRIDKTNNEVVLEFYPGQSYNDKWHAIYGGGQMGLELSHEIPQVIYDLSQIDIKPIVSDKRIKLIPFFKFNYRDWKRTFKITAEKYVQAGLLTAGEVRQANNIFKTKFESKYILSNGDFYPGNFIQQSDKIVLIDWQTWDNGYRANLIDYWENVMAFCFIHMWMDQPWQMEFLKHIQIYFDLDPEKFQKAVLIKSFEQTGHWWGREKTHKYAENQMGIFKTFLDREYVRKLLADTRPNRFYRYFRPLINLFR